MSTNELVISLIRITVCQCLTCLLYQSNIVCDFDKIKKKLHKNAKNERNWIILVLMPQHPHCITLHLGYCIHSKVDRNTSTFLSEIYAFFVFSLASFLGLFLHHTSLSAVFAKGGSYEWSVSRLPFVLQFHLASISFFQN